MASSLLSASERPASTRSRILALAMAVAAVGLVLALRPRPTSPAAVDQLFAVDEYAGSGACAGCHRRESEQFAATAHAQALRRADSESTAAHLIGRALAAPQEGEAGHPRIEYFSKDGRFWATMLGPAAGKPVPIEWCFGSGEQGTTFVTVLNDSHGRSRLLEHHWSWFQDDDVLELTPGHTIADKARDFDRFGQVFDPGTTRHCFSCHTTAFPYDAGRIDTDRLVPGIQCERCHGPRQAHVDAKLLEQTPSRVAARPHPPARQQVYACGECHRRPDEINDEIRPDNPVLVRFPSVGLVQSKCFLASESKGTLTCTTCHDPHRAQHPPISSFDQKCQSCHDPRVESTNVPCPVNSLKRSCVGCHMPKVDLHSHLKFTDHWIRTPRQL